MRFARIRDGIAEITHRLYSDIPTADLVTARRVLSTVTERANLALAGERLPTTQRHPTEHVPGGSGSGGLRGST